MGHGVSVRDQVNIHEELARYTSLWTRTLVVVVLVGTGGLIKSL
jgi:hypothetical protein